MKIQALLFDLDNTLFDADRLQAGYRQSLGLSPEASPMPAQRFRQGYDRFVEQHLRADPELLAWLGALAQRYRLGLASNGSRERQRRKLRLLEIGPFFEVVFISGEQGLAKPDPDFFRRLADRLGLPPAACLMIGDDLDLDIAGALAAGMRGCWLRRGRTPPPAGVPGDSIETIWQLREVLAC